MTKLESTTSYFLAEGKTNLTECLRLSFLRASQAGIRTIVMFTLNGAGVEIACNEFLSDARYRNQRIVAVSFPFGAVPSAALEMPESRMELFKRFDITLLRSVSPLDGALASNNRQNNLVRKTLEIFSGGTALCIWGILAACDAGVIPFGEHVIGCCADTSLVAKATPTAQFLSAFAVREFVCKPLIQNISKGEALGEEINTEVIVERDKPKSLGEQRKLPQQAEQRQPK
jgi:hypothetical protein